MYLFIDTSVKVIVGVLNENFSWADYKEIESKKSSTILHDEILQSLDSLNLDIKEIKGLIHIAGPGSYTGMRVSEGVKQIFSWQKFKTFSFYHFDVPKILGHKEGAWIGKAFKGEYFIHSWNDHSSEQELIKESDFNLSHHLYSADGSIEKSLSTIQLIKDSSQVLFKDLVERKVDKSLFYYRSVEEEFGKGAK